MIFARAVGELELIAAVNIHAPDLRGAAAIRYENDVAIVASGDGCAIHGRVNRQLSLFRAVRLHDPEVAIPAGS